jgi:hypothetical protein
MNKWCKFASSFLSNNIYGLPVQTKDTKCPNYVFYVSLVHLQNICATYGLETWFCPNHDIRKCLLAMKHGWTKNVFWGVNMNKWRKWCKFVSPNLSHDTYGLLGLTMEIKCSNHVFYVWLVDQQTTCAKYGLEVWITSNNIRICLLDMRHVWYKNAFWDVNNKKWLNGVNYFQLSYLTTLMAYLCSQWTPKIQIYLFMFDWSIYSLFVINRGWKRDSQQIMMLENVCSTCDVVEL